MKVDKTELCDILNIKNRTLKDIESKDQLKERLQNKGYEFINKTKEGRKVYYEIELINENKEVYSNLCKYIFKTDNKDEFKDYFIHRTFSTNFPLSIKDIADKSNVSPKTVTRWDNTLIDNNILYKDGYYYFSIDKEEYTIKQCTQEEYKSFWRNKAYINAFHNLQNKYMKGLITLTELQLASAEIGATMALVENKYYYRIKKYGKNNNQLYEDTLKLIKNIYGNTDIKIEYELVE